MEDKMINFANSNSNEFITIQLDRIVDPDSGDKRGDYMVHLSGFTRPFHIKPGKGVYVFLECTNGNHLEIEIFNIDALCGIEVSDKNGVYASDITGSGTYIARKVEEVINGEYRIINA